MTSEQKHNRTQGIIFLFAAWVWFGLALWSLLDGGPNQTQWAWACIAVGFASAIAGAVLLSRSRKA